MSDITWLPCPEELGVALWRTLRAQLGTTCSVGETYTSDRHVITTVWAISPSVPLLRCESFYNVIYAADGLDYTRDAGEHHYALPADTSGAAEKEREAVVTWLMDEAPFMECQGGFAEEYADAIERGEHTKKVQS